MKRSHKLPLAPSALAIACTGCSAAPSFDISGSFFPAWMLCLIVGVILTFAARHIFLRLRIADAIGPPALIYPSLLALFSCLLWLILFR